MWKLSNILLEKQSQGKLENTYRTMKMKPQLTKTRDAEVFRGKSIGVNVCIEKGLGQPGWLSGLAPPLARGVILEARDQVPHRGSLRGPASPSACVSASLSVSLMDK